MSSSRGKTLTQNFDRTSAKEKEMKRYFMWSCLASVVLTLTVSLGMAQQSGSSPPDQIEEDWQVIVANPDPVAIGPQITTCASPNSVPTGSFVTFYLNYQDYPSWNAGGLQVKAYGPVANPGSSPPVLNSSNQGNGVCETQGETITWTQQMSLSGGNLQYNVVNGQSSTWGKFGQGVGTLAVSMPCTVADLGSYKPDYSVSKSGVSWQSNRVTSMTLLQVRYYSGGKLLSTDSTARQVNLSPGN
jgi:hypothetical protein